MTKEEEIKKIKKRIARIEKVVNLIVKWINFWETVKTPWVKTGKIEKIKL